MQAMRRCANTTVQPGAIAALAGVRPRSLRATPAGRSPRDRPAVENIRRVGRSGGKINLSGVDGMMGHLAEQERPIRAAQSRHREAIVDRIAREAELLPGEIVGIVRREEGALQRRGAVGSVTIPLRPRSSTRPLNNDGLRLRHPHPMRRDARRLTFGERPARGLEREVELAYLEEARRRTQRSSEPLERMTTEPPIVAASSAPASIVRPSTIRLGRPISKPCSIVRVCSPSLGRSKA